MIPSLKTSDGDMTEDTEKQGKFTARAQSQEPSSPSEAFQILRSS